MLPDDVDAAAAALLASDWGDRRTWFGFATVHPACRTIVAEDDDGIVGTGVGTRNGSAGWVGTIWVAPRLRRRGLGRELTDVVCADLAARGCRTLVLVATPAGRLLYETMGFDVVDEYVTFERASSEGDAVPEGIRQFAAADVEMAAALDAAATGEDRAHLIAAFAEIPGGLALPRDDGRIAGFCVRAPWGGGATIAPDAAAALTLLRARLASGGPGHRVRAGTLASNETGLALLRADGWSEAWRAPRMQRGEPLAWIPSAIWGQFNHAVG